MSLQGDASNPEISQETSELRALMGAFPDLYFWLDSEGRYLKFYAVQPSDLYPSPEQFMGKTIRDVLPVDVSLKIYEGIARASETGTVVMTEYSLELAEGIKHFECRIIPLEGQKFLAVVRDVTEKTNYQNSLKASEEKYRVIAESNDEIFYVISIAEKPFSGKVHYVSAQIKRLLGYEAEEFQRNPQLWKEIVHPDDLPGIEESRRRIIHTGRAEMREYRVRHKETGQYIWLEEKVAPHLDGNGKVVGFQKVARDITDRKNTEEALRRAKERFELAAMAVQSAIYDWDLEKGETFWSQGLKEVFGYLPEEAALERGWWEKRIHPEDLHYVLDEIAGCMKDGKLTFAEYRFLCRDGKFRYVLDRAHGIKNENGQVIRIVGSMLDISDRKVVDEALRQNEARLQAILNNQPECVKILALDGTLLEMNPAGLRMIEADSMDQVQGRNILQLIHPEDRLMFRQFHAAVGRGETGVIRFRVIGLHGTMRWLESNVVPLRNTSGQINSVLGVTRDITERKKAEEALLESEDRYRSLMTQSSEGIFIFDPYSKKIQEANPVFLSMLGYSEDEIATLTLYDISSDSPAATDFNVQTVLHSGQLFLYPAQYRRKNGSLIEVEIRATLVSYGDSQIVLVNVADLTERKRAEALQSALYGIAEKTAAAEDLPEFYRSIHRIVGELMNTGNFFIALYDRSLDMLSFPYFVDEFDSVPEPNRPGKSLTAYVLRTGAPLLATPQVFEELVREGEVEEHGSSSIDWLGVPLKSGEHTIGVLVVQSYRNTVRLGEKEKEILTFVSQHIASALERKRAQETIRHHAYHDVLTLLPNRALFHDRFSQAMTRVQREGGLLAMLFLDLDRFKTINDTLGHAVGDRLLQNVAERLSGALREGDTIARLGGDEFMILVAGIHHVEDAAKIADKILRAFRQPFLLDGHELHITTSIGISLYPHDGFDAETLFKNADIALYRAKDRGRNTYQLYTSAMNARAHEQLAMENKLRRAIEQEELLLHYQPLISISSGKAVGMEALVRWQNPDGALIYPSDFISLSEDTGLIVPLGEWVLHHACEQNRRWQDEGMSPLPVSVNISARQFQQQNLVGTITRILSDTKLNPASLELELTESVFMKNPEMAAEILQELQEKGIRISIDDFGSGYSSLSSLRRFPIGTLKIDQSFVRHCFVDSDDAAIVSAIISMGQSLKLKVVAEGVETEDQLRFLRDHRCDIVQGFLFSRPVPAPEFLLLLQHGFSASV